MKVLFVCTRNVARSPMAESLLGEMLREHGRHEARSVGTASDASRRLTTRDLAWADVIAVMDDAHRALIEASWPTHVRKVLVLGVADEYDPDEPALRGVLAPKIRELIERVEVAESGAAPTHLAIDVEGDEGSVRANDTVARPAVTRLVASPGT